MASMAEPTKHLTPKQVAQEYNISKNTLYGLLKVGAITSVDISPKAKRKKGNHRPTYRIRREDVERFLAGEQTRR